MLVCCAASQSTTLDCCAAAVRSYTTASLVTPSESVFVTVGHVIPLL